MRNRQLAVRAAIGPALVERLRKGVADARAALAVGLGVAFLAWESGSVTLAALLGVRYRPDVDGTIAHSNIITLLDAGGEIAVQQEGLGTDPAPAVAALRQAFTP